jgi:hypothetical protein
LSCALFVSGFRVCGYNCGQGRVAGIVRPWPSGGDYLGGYGTDLPLFRHLATADRQQFQRRLFLMVFLIQSTQNRDAQTMRMKLNELIRVSTARNIMGSGKLLGTGNQGNQSGVHESGREFPQKIIEQELNERSRNFNSGRSS